jgi:hypothetical protein
MLIFNYGYAIIIKYKTYYVVAQMGLFLCKETATDYMLGTMFLVNYLLFMLHYLRMNLDASGSFNLPMKSENNNYTIFNNKNINIQSAENFKGFSETIRQFSDSKVKIDSDDQFYSWFAGIVDGDGNFDIRKNSLNKPVLKAIRIKLHNRDVRILTRIQNKLHFGRINNVKNKPYSIFIVSTKKEMEFILNKLNGLIRIKLDGFKKACLLYNIKFIEPDYNIKSHDSYFAGLIDTDGSIVFNFTSNRIECNLEFKYNEYTSQLNFDDVILGQKPYVLLRSHGYLTGKKKSVVQSLNRHKSIAFKFQTVNGMLPLYDYFIKNRLYSDFKFYRVTQIKRFMEIRHFQKSEFDSLEYKIYSDFVLKWIQYQNPLWTKVLFVKKLRIS